MFACSNVWASMKIEPKVVENSNNKKTILHEVKAHESCYSIARKYGVSPKSISDIYGKDVLKVGMIIKIIPNTSLESRKNLHPLIDYIIQPKETLYAIAKKAGMTVDEIKEINKLKSNDLTVGEVLKVRTNLTPGQNSNLISNSEKNIEVTSSLSLDNEPDEDLDIEENRMSSNSKNRLKFPASKYGLNETSERGVAVWMSDEYVDGSQLLALHRSAPIGTVIKVTNPMTQKTAFAKVVGKFTENESTRNVIIVLTKAVADLVGALDKKFQVNLTYGVPNG